MGRDLGERESGSTAGSVARHRRHGAAERCPHPGRSFRRSVGGSEARGTRGRPPRGTNGGEGKKGNTRKDRTRKHGGVREARGSGKAPVRQRTGAFFVP